MTSLTWNFKWSFVFFWKNDKSFFVTPLNIEFPKFVRVFKVKVMVCLCGLNEMKIATIQQFWRHIFFVGVQCPPSKSLRTCMENLLSKKWRQLPSCHIPQMCTEWIGTIHVQFMRLSPVVSARINYKIPSKLVSFWLGYGQRTS